jgi:hypothetical protein
MTKRKDEEAVRNRKEENGFLSVNGRFKAHNCRPRNTLIRHLKYLYKKFHRLLAASEERKEEHVA